MSGIYKCRLTTAPRARKDRAFRTLHPPVSEADDIVPREHMHDTRPFAFDRGIYCAITLLLIVYYDSTNDDDKKDALRQRRKTSRIEAPSR